LEELVLSPSLLTARERIRALSHLNAFLSLTDDEGTGPVVAVKDLIDVRGSVTTAGSPIAARGPAPEDAEVVRHIRRSGCVIVGKTNLCEWALGPTGENPHYGPALNPRDPSRMSGGSSSGSAVAVAAGMCAWAIGTDTGGSIRIPASLCGVVGFKPTLGIVSTDGVVPLSPSLDTVGPLAPSVSEIARAFEVISGTTVPLPEQPMPLGKLRLATPARWVADLDQQTSLAWAEVIERLRPAEIPFPDLARAVNIGVIILRVEASAFHRPWLLTSPERYGASTRARLELGMHVPAVDYVDALSDARRFRRDVEEALLDWDALILPTTACVAPLWETENVNEPLARFVRPFNVSGHPALSLPVPGPGLPVGLQVVGHYGQDARLLRAALAVEHALLAGR
jgi:aspartyl-tRNA(Asn)/glutamyl-tRNA(Gln) amidotransferase subunit A